MLQLYTDSSPNGFKISIALEELQLPYEVHHVSIERGEHKLPEYLKLNPYGRIPALVDSDTGITLFESAAILLFLAEKTQRLLPKNPKARWEAITWLMFHSSTMGPTLGQRVNFEIFAKEKIPSVIQRYQSLSEDILTTLDNRLSDRSFLSGEEYSIADIATFGWMHIWAICDFSFAHHKNLSRWYETVKAREAVQRGILIPEPATGP